MTKTVAMLALALTLAGCATGLPTQALSGQSADQVAQDHRDCEAAGRAVPAPTGPDILVRPSPPLTAYASCLLARGYAVKVPMTVTTSFGLGYRMPDVDMTVRADQPTTDAAAAAALVTCRDAARDAARIRLADASPGADLGHQAVAVLGLGLANPDGAEDARALIACLAEHGLTAR